MAGRTPSRDESPPSLRLTTSSHPVVPASSVLNPTHLVPKIRLGGIIQAPCQLCLMQSHYPALRNGAATRQYWLVFVDLPSDRRPRRPAACTKHNVSVTSFEYLAETTGSLIKSLPAAIRSPLGVPTIVVAIQPAN